MDEQTDVVGGSMGGQQLVSGTEWTVVEIGDVASDNEEEAVREQFQACDIASVIEMEHEDTVATDLALTEPDNGKKTFQELQPVGKDFLMPTSSRRTLKRAHDITKERKDEHKRWRTAIDGYVQYSEWINKVSEKAEDMPDLDTSESVTTDATEDPEAEYFFAADSMKQMIAEIEKERAALSEKEAESDAKLEEILKYCEERTKRTDFDKDAKQDYQMFVCFACGRVFDDEITMRNHVNEIHLVSKDYAFKCSQCYRRFKMKHHLQRHERTHDLSLVHVCDRCSSSFRTFESLIAHRSRMHRIDEDGAPISSLSYSCNKCKQKFGTFVELNRHKYLCLNETRLKQQKESSKSGVMSVSSTRSSIFSLSSRPKVDKTCRLCHKQFASRQSMIRHMGRIHPEEKVDEIKRYEVVPSPDLPFACNICSKRFTTKTLMLVHRKRHEGRNFACEFCEKTYPLASELRKHIKRVHGNSHEGTSMASGSGSDATTVVKGSGDSAVVPDIEQPESPQQSGKHDYEDLSGFNIM